MKKVSSSLKLELAQYHEMMSFAQFGSDLDASTKKILDHGAKLTELLKQPQYQPMSMCDQVLTLFAAKNGFFDEIDIDSVSKFENSMHRFFHESHQEICDKIEEKGDIDDELNTNIKQVMNEALDNFKLLSGVN